MGGGGGVSCEQLIEISLLLFFHTLSFLGYRFYVRISLIKDALCTAAVLLQSYEIETRLFSLVHNTRTEEEMARICNRFVLPSTP